MLDTSEYSFGYITGWSKDKEVSELKDNLEIIKNTADDITSQIEKGMQEKETEQEEEIQGVRSQKISGETIAVAPSTKGNEAAGAQKIFEW